MTPEEHERLQLRAQVVVYRGLMIWAAERLAVSLSTPSGFVAARALGRLESLLAATKEDHLGLVFPELSPAESDLWAALVQDAYDFASREFMNALREGMPKR